MTLIFLIPFIRAKWFLLWILICAVNPPSFCQNLLIISPHILCNFLSPASDVSSLPPISSLLFPYPKDPILSTGTWPSEGSNCQIELWIAQSVAGILACTSTEYAGGKIKMWNLHLSTPKMCSTTFQAEVWRRLKSSSSLAGLCIEYSVSYSAFNNKIHTEHWHIPTLQDGSAHLSMGKPASAR